MSVRARRALRDRSAWLCAAVCVAGAAALAVLIVVWPYIDWLPSFGLPELPLPALNLLVAAIVLRAGMLAATFVGTFQASRHSDGRDPADVRRLAKALARRAGSLARLAFGWAVIGRLIRTVARRFGRLGQAAGLAGRGMLSASSVAALIVLADDRRPMTVRRAVALASDRIDRTQVLRAVVVPVLAVAAAAVPAAALTVQATGGHTVTVATGFVVFGVVGLTAAALMTGWRLVAFDAGDKAERAPGPR